MINEFKEKFSQLLLHYTTFNATIKDPDIHRPLTNQQIFDAVEEVLRDKLNITLNNLNSSLLKTATDEIVFGIPNAPDVLRIDYKRNALFQRRMASFSSVTPGGENEKSQSSTNLSSHSEEKLKVSGTDKSSVSPHKENANGNITMEKSTNGCDIVSKGKKKRKRRKKNCRNLIAAGTAQSTTASSPPQHCPNDETCSKSGSDDIQDFAEMTDVPGPYWHGTPSAVRLLNLYHFVYEEYGYQFRPSSEDLFFFEWMGATQRLYPWLKWKTANIVARSIGSPDLVSCPFDVREIPPVFDYYFREDHLGFLRTDQSFYQMNLHKGLHNQFVKFCFALYQAKAASLSAPGWEVECCNNQVQGDLLTALCSKMPAGTPMKVIGKLEELRAILVQPETRPNRGLSTMMTHPPLNSYQQQLNHQAPGSAKKPSNMKPATKLLMALGQHNRSNSTLAPTKSSKSAAVK